MTARKPLAFLTCGALRREVAAVVRLNGWTAEIHTISALLHLYPKQIVEAVRTRLGSLNSEYDRVIVVYGDCGTAGELDRVLEEFGAVRLPVAHCYELFADGQFDDLTAEEPGTFFLTDWLVVAFDRVVRQALGLDRYPELHEVYFGNYSRVLYLQQVDRPVLTARAAAIAEYLRLPLVLKSVGLAGLTRELVPLVSARPDRKPRVPVMEASTE